MSGHTPGPWNKDRYGVLRGADGAAVVVADSGLAFASGYEAPERVANARLISSAPELLEACELLLATYGELHALHDLGECEGSVKARAAIAKATGADQ